MFFTYRQTNSGGAFFYDLKKGITVNVIIEADSAKDADIKAEKIGLYFHGVDKGRDCDCCVDRWSPAYDDGEGTLRPEVSGQLAETDDAPQFYTWKDGTTTNLYKWVKGYEVFIHYIDGTIAKKWK